MIVQIPLPLRKSASFSFNRSQLHHLLSTSPNHPPSFIHQLSYNYLSCYSSLAVLYLHQSISLCIIVHCYSSPSHSDQAWVAHFLNSHPTSQLVSNTCPTSSPLSNYPSSPIRPHFLDTLPQVFESSITFNSSNF